VDEVLAVGDAEFQKKALGKMKDISKGEGRTVIFVSHNMMAIKNLCNSVIYMNNGIINRIGPKDEVINFYLSHNNSNTGMRQFFEAPNEAPGSEEIKLRRIELCPLLQTNTDPITVKTALDIEFEFWCYIKDAEINLSMSLFTIMDDCVFVVASNAISNSSGQHSAICKIPPDLLNDGIYNISMLVVVNGEARYSFTNAITFEVNENRQANVWHGKWPGILRPKLDFQLT
jgi:lipopolysaccharide transport system ATP-binding protein